LAQQGFSLTSYREFIKGQVRRERLQQMFLQKSQAQGTSVMVDEQEVREAWEEQRAQIPPLPASVSAYQVVVEPTPSDSARAAARAEAERLLEQVRAGEDFETLARRFSQDPGSAPQGGDLGWFRRGVMVPEFEDVAFRLPENRVSEVVDTDFGSHIIKMERVRGGERKARHILITAEVTDADVQRARERAAELRRRVDGGESLSSLRAEFGVEGPGALPDSIFTPLDQIGELPEGYRPMATASPGDILGPIEFDFQGRSHFAVVEVEEVREAGPRTFDDVKDQLRARLQEQKVLERIIQRLRERSYVEVRM
jgi:parvulin-like peptidyl-prolyl isomerase